jgi:hypothetical protein
VPTKEEVAPTEMSLVVVVMSGGGGDEAVEEVGEVGGSCV